MKSLTILFYTTLSLLLLNGCSTPQKTSTPVTSKTASDTLEPSPEQMISLARNSADQETRANFYLKAAQKYFEYGLIAQSSTVASELNINHLSADDIVRALTLNLQLAINKDLDRHLQISLDLLKRTTLDNTNIETLKKLIPLISKMHEKQNSMIESAILLIEYSGILDSTDYAEHNNNIWQLLRKIPPIQLNNFTYQGKDLDVNAWLELAILFQQNQISLESQYQSYQQWQNRWPSHPAITNPPRELELLSKLPETRPAQIIIALPFTGPIAEVGKAVRDGFMASYLSLQNQDNTTYTNVSFFDTNKNAIENLYSTTRDKKTLIIGPLTKNNVRRLQNLDLSNTSTLALNYLEPSPLLTTPENLYQFGLNPETEIEQISNQLSKRQLNKIAFIAPENDHGFRMHDYLLKSLGENQSIIIESVYYQDQKSLSPAVAKLLATDQSSNRKNKVQRITNLSLEFEPRRRNDIDAIFMLAKPQIASQLNPLFAYHYARNLPIYSNSEIHQINQRQNDLDNIYFVEMPWMLSNTIDIKNLISKVLPSAKSEYSRFYALGADAFTLAPRLKLLKEIQNSQVQGHTGTLTIDSSGVVHRELELAVFKRGRAIAIKE